MTIEDRRDREKLQMKNLIVQAAAHIIVNEGYDKLSIRKIANQIEYSPAIIYHYFSNKNEILSQVLRQGYQTLMSALSDGQTTNGTPETRIKVLTRKYIDAALENPDQFLAVQLNNSPEVLEFTAYLFEGAAAEKPALTILAQAVQDICAGQNVSSSEIELTAQIIAASTLGLITKLILEKDISEQQRKQLIDQFAETVVRMARRQPETEPVSNNVMKRKGTIK
ncbi:MAG TPA: TetR/AcrR family transcriptional regulator [Anaerovoracaceae bacterium]|nr:TetR/AcrR family transcriptional regulator [Anaerovoracaceae bacterium]